MSETNDHAGGASPSEPGAHGPGTQGADNARAYVPPQTLKAKARPSDSGEQAKVQIKEGIDPRKVKTVAKGTLPVNQAIPAEALNHPAAVGSVGGPATPFEAPAPPARVDNALPFQKPAAVSAPPMVGAAPSAAPAAAPAGPAVAAPAAAPMNGVRAGGGFTPKHPPLTLTGPGVLTPVQGAVAAPDVPAATTPAASQPPVTPQVSAPPAGAAPAPVTPAPITPAEPIAPAVAVSPEMSPGGVAAASPNVASPEVAAPSASDSGDSEPPQKAPANADDGEHPLAATNSPWTSPENAEKVEAVDLPSADFLPSAQVSAAPAEPKPAPAVEEGGGSRTLMTVGLAVAVLALIGAVAYFTVIDRKEASPDDPAKVNVGSEQRDYDMNEDGAPAPKPTTEPKEAPKPVAPKVVPKALPKVPVKPTRPIPRKKPEDVYDGL